MKLMARIIALVAALIITSAVWADSAAPPTDAPINMDQALEIAFKRNPDLRVATEAVNKARGMIKESGARFNPSFTAQITHGIQGPEIILPASELTGNMPVTMMPSKQTSKSLKMFLPLDIFHQLRYGSNIAHDQFNISYLDLLRTSQQLISQVKKNYYELLRAQGQRDTAQAAVDVAALRLKNTDARFNAGSVPKFDVTTAQVDLANLNQSLIAAQSRVSIARAGLNRTLGLNADTPTQVVNEKVIVDPSSVDADEATKKALAERPEIKMQQAGISLSKSNIQLQRTAIRPSLGISGSFNQSDAQGFSSNTNSWNATAALNLPIWDGGVTKAKVEQAHADLHSAEDSLEQAQLGIKQEVVTLALVMEEAALRTKTTAESVALADEALRLANVRYEAGIAVLLEVTNAESQLTQARFNEVNALYDYAIARADLQRATSTQPEIEKLKLVDYKPTLDLESAQKSEEE